MNLSPLACRVVPGTRVPPALNGDSGLCSGGRGQGRDHDGLVERPGSSSRQESIQASVGRENGVSARERSPLLFQLT